MNSVACLIAVFMIISPNLYAESKQGDPPSAEAVNTRALFSKRVDRELAQRGIQVAIVARLGQPRSTLPKAERYTHVGFAVYSTIKNYGRARTIGLRVLQPLSAPR